MDIFRAAERLMAMDDATWRRHANPWSVWSRMLTALPLLVLAIWCRVWVGLWAIVPVALAVAWVWINPRLFPEPRRFDSWASKGVLGERVFIEHRGEVSAHHVRVAHILSWLSVPGALVMIWGLWAQWWEGAVFGAILTALPKIWFVDRMGWILQDWRALGHDVPGVDENEL